MPKNTLQESSHRIQSQNIGDFPFPNQLFMYVLRIFEELLKQV